MQIDMTDRASRAGLAPAGDRLPIFNLRWGAVFAGLVVGVAANTLLLLAGAAVGLAVVDVGEPGGPAMPVAAGIWNTLSMLLAALAGGYVAARAAGLRRSSDGVLHGVVAWGVTMVLSMLLATTVTGALVGGMVPGTAGRSGVTAEVMRSIDAGERAAAVATLQQRLGVSSEQANRIIDQALILAGREEQASTEARAETEQTLRTASAASGWLSAAIVLSLLAAMGGGALGARGTRREAHGPQQRRAVAVDSPPPPRKTVRVE